MEDVAMPHSLKGWALFAVSVVAVNVALRVTGIGAKIDVWVAKIGV
jgi:hypothetical protein